MTVGCERDDLFVVFLLYLSLSPRDVSYHATTYFVSAGSEGDSTCFPTTEGFFSTVLVFRKGVFRSVFQNGFRFRSRCFEDEDDTSSLKKTGFCLCQEGVFRLQGTENRFPGGALPVFVEAASFLPSNKEVGVRIAFAWFIIRQPRDWKKACVCVSVCVFVCVSFAKGGRLRLGGKSQVVLFCFLFLSSSLIFTYFVHLVGR